MSKRNTQRLLKGKKMCVHFNAICAVCMGVLLLFFFLDFFNMYIEGSGTESRTSGFKMAFSFGEADKNNFLSLVNNSSPSKVMFASTMSFLCMFALLAMCTVFIYRAVTQRTILSRYVILFAGITVVLFALQTVAYGTLTSAATAMRQNSCCPNDSANTFNFITLVLFLVFCGVYYGMCERLHTKYGIGFPE